MARTKRRGRIRRAASERQRAHQLTLDRPTWTNLSRLARLHRTSWSAIVRTLIAEAMKNQKLAEERGTQSRRPDAHTYSTCSPTLGPGFESDQARFARDPLTKLTQNP